MPIVTLEIITEQLVYEIDKPEPGLWAMVVRDEDENIMSAYAGVNPWMSAVLDNGVYIVEAQRKDEEGDGIGQELTSVFSVTEDTHINISPIYTDTDECECTCPKELSLLQKIKNRFK